MESDDQLEFPEGDFISGIYNYCNRWCERCIYTDKCRTFAMEKSFRREIETKKRFEKSMAENKDFWDQVNKTISDAATLIDEEIPIIKTDFSSLFEMWEEDDDADEAIKEHKEKQAKAKNHALSKVAKKYEKTVHDWFKEREDTLKQEFNPETEVFDVSHPEVTDEFELKQFAEMLEVIQWYHIQIWVKINRALSSFYEEDEDPELFEDFPKDSDGSAMVALKGIDNSIGAWISIKNKLASDSKSIKPMIRMLLWLKMEMEKLFPKAKDFIWPPKSKE